MCEKPIGIGGNALGPYHARVTPSTSGSLEGNDIHVNIKKYKNDLN